MGSNDSFLKAAKFFRQQIGKELKAKEARRKAEEAKKPAPKSYAPMDLKPIKALFVEAASALQAKTEGNDVPYLNVPYRECFDDIEESYGACLRRTLFNVILRCRKEHKGLRPLFLALSAEDIEELEFCSMYEGVRIVKREGAQLIPNEALPTPGNLAISKGAEMMINHFT